MPSFGEWLATLPLVSRTVFVVLVLIHVLHVFTLDTFYSGFDPVMARFAHRPIGDTLRGFFLAPLSHVNNLHLCCNGLTVLTLLAEVERRLGTVGALTLSLFLWPTTMLLTIVGYSLTYGVMWPNQRLSLMGYSGVLFGVYTTFSFGEVPDSRPSFCGFFEVPARWMVFVYLVLIQLALPEASFIGHAAGIALGLLVALVLPRHAFANPCGLAESGCVTSLRGALSNVFRAPDDAARPWTAAKEPLFNCRGRGGTGPTDA
uniref:Peptidase S54 rhomboid domain-containing protein n=1 Tax=Neobodo designis TaxID=312471 RepID=A0A7S1PQE6_NEODS|mmetsp:Transcript_155/g.591  ORF Transcript_155/g.591 Transcript_155/m.591 type:complete len:260 (+) Transcript_155:44-823(+)